MSIYSQKHSGLTVRIGRLAFLRGRTDSPIFSTELSKLRLTLDSAQFAELFHAAKRLLLSKMAAGDTPAGRGIEVKIQASKFFVILEGA